LTEENNSRTKVGHVLQVIGREINVKYLKGRHQSSADAESRGYHTHGQSQEGMSPSVNIAIDLLIILKSLIRETAVWHYLRHKNVLEFLGLAPDLGRYGCPALISPYCERGTAKNYFEFHSDVDTKLFVVSSPSPLL
jgi:hypothetical protein